MWRRPPLGSVAYNPVAVPDESGGGLLAWADQRNFVSTGVDLYVQRINASGVALCTATGDQNIVRIAWDTAGALYAAWEEGRNLGVTGLAGYAQKLSSAGVPQWTTDGIVVCALNGTQTHRVLAPVIGFPGYSIWVAWQDARTDGGEIYAQSFTSTGVPMQVANGVTVHNIAANTHSPHPKS